MNETVEVTLNITVTTFLERLSLFGTLFENINLLCKIFQCHILMSMRLLPSHIKTR